MAEQPRGGYWTDFWRRRSSRRAFIRGTAYGGLGLAAATLVGCGDEGGGTGGGGTGAEPQLGGDLIVGYALNPSSLDPHLGNSGGDDYYWRAMFDTLVGVDQNYNPDPSTSLASSWEIADDTTIVFHLRDGVTLHDGTKLDSELVKWNIERVKDPQLRSTYRALMAPVERVETPDPLTARFVLNAPDSALFGHLYQRAGAIVSRQAAEQYGDQFGSHPVGSGPFVFQEWVPNSQVRMTKNPNYWRKDGRGVTLPYLNSVTMRIIPDPTSALASLVAGQLHFTGIDPKDLQQVESNPSLNLIRREGSGVSSLFVFNLDKPAVRDVKVRQAICAAVDPEAVNRAVYFGTATVSKGFMWAPGLWVYEEIPDRPSHDPAKAKQLLSAAGFPNGLDVELITWTDSNTIVQQATQYQAQLRQVGINARISQFNVGTATANFFTNGQGDFYSTSWSMYPEPDNIATNNLAPNAFYNPMKRAVDPQVEELLQKGRATYDQEERREVYTQLAKISLDQAYYVPFIFGTALVALDKKVQGTDTLIDGAIKWVYHQLWLA